MKINVLIFGGSGNWAEKHYYTAILKLREEGYDIKVVGICDPVDPSTLTDHHKLRSILKEDNPIWINPYNQSKTAIEKKLNELNNSMSIDVAIICTNPTFHFDYCIWALEKSINIICDKPLVIDNGAAYDINAAQSQYEKYHILRKRINEKLLQDKNYKFYIPLKRRVLKPFQTIINSLNEIYQTSSEGIKYLDLTVDGGIHRYPIEFLKGGAHGFVEGVGSLSHSSFHFIDAIAMCLCAAPGKIYSLEIELPYILRVKDYLKAKGYKKLMELIEDNTAGLEINENEISEAALNTELDFTFSIKLKDKEDNLIGHINYTSRHTTFTPRLTKYKADMIDHANSPTGGRMTQILLNIHQGALQNWISIKNDLLSEEDIIENTQRLHPNIGETLKKEVYRNAYHENTLTTELLVESFFKSIFKEDIPTEHEKFFKEFKIYDLTNEIFYKFYEKIAENFINQNQNKKIKINSIINFKKYAI